MSELTKRLRDRAKRYEWGMGYPELSRDEEVAELRSAADRIDKLEECLREVVRRLDSMANWRIEALAYDADVGNPPRSFCEDIELVEQAAKDAAGYARALLGEK